MKGKTNPDERMQAMTFLRERYPNAFRQPNDVKPLEIGIKGKLVSEIKDRLPEGLSLRAIYVALHYYCCTKEYKKVRKVVGTPRINLAGEVVGEVTEAHLEVGRQLDMKKQQKKIKQLAREKQLAAKRLEKQAQSARTMTRKTVKETKEVGQAKLRIEGGVQKSSLTNHYQSNGTTANRIRVKPTLNKEPLSHSTKPTVIVRKKKNFNFSQNIDNKTEK